MTDNYRKFVETYKSPNSQRAAMSMWKIGEYDYTNCTEADVERVILDLKPKGVKEISIIFTFIGRYAEYIGNDTLSSIVKNMDRNEIWEQVKHTDQVSKKFLSYSDFEQAYKAIGTFEEFNGFYQQELFRCVYEGIYNEDMSVIKNLRASDVHGNIVTLRDDNEHTYDLEISHDLAENLKELGNINVWERNNRRGICKIKMTGVYPDSCFKTEIRKNASEYSYQHAYYRILRKIYNNYIDIEILPRQIYISGIMHRICQKLIEQNIDLEEAFSFNNKDRLTTRIISDELVRCNYMAKTGAFRETVSCHLSDFTNE